MNQRQAGITIIETLGALAIASMMLIGLTAMIDRSLDDAKGQQAALHQAQVVAAARKYIAANYDFLLQQTNGSSIPYALSVDTLRDQKFLSGGFSSTNAYRQTPCVLLRQPVTGKLDALVATSGGDPIPERDLPFVAASAGKGGGYISAEHFAEARGASWRLQTTDYRKASCPGGDGSAVLSGARSDGGHLVSALFYDGPGQLATDFLYRNAVPGRPDLNTMNTPLRMNMKSGSAAVVAIGDACGSDAGLAFSKQKELLSCGESGRWSAVTLWRSPVDSYDALPTEASATPPETGEVRVTRDQKRAFFYDGKNWVALAVDQKGNLAMEGDLIAGGDVSAGNDVQARRDLLSQQGNIWALAAKNARDQYEAGMTDKGIVFAEGFEGRYTETDWVGADVVSVHEKHQPGDACHISFVPPLYDRSGHEIFLNPVGTFAVDNAYRPLMCGPDHTFRYANGTYLPQ